MEKWLAISLFLIILNLVAAQEHGNSSFICLSNLIPQGAAGLNQFLLGKYGKDSMFMLVDEGTFRVLNDLHSDVMFSTITHRCIYFSFYGRDVTR